MAVNHFAALRGKFSTLEMAYEMAHFLRMAFIGASSGAAFFFMARRRFMVIAVFAFIAFIAFAMAKAGRVWRLAGRFGSQGASVDA